ncbi:MAG: sensor domain-containing diguanylate cyclase [Spirochaetes bacterium]|nr:sensor domain-containing diguanylate cyclase [Spirochaetota bacterium]
MLFLKSPFLKKLFVTLFFIVFLGFGTLTFLISTYVRSSFRQTQLKTISNVHDHVRTSILGWFQEKRKNIEGLAKMMENAPEHHPNFLKPFKQAYSEFADVILINEKGYIVATSERVRYESGIQLSDREYFQQAMEGKSFISGFFRGRFRGVATLSISAPVFKDGKPHQVLAGFITLRKFLEIFAPIGNDSEGLSPIRIHFINARGQVISHPEYITQFISNPEIETDLKFISDSRAVKDLLKGESGASIYTHDGKGYYGAYSWIEPLQVGLVVETDQEVQESSLEVQLRSMVLATTMVFLVLLGFIAMSLWYVSKPIAQVIEAMENLISGSFSPGKLFFHRTGSQVDRLVDTFQQLREAVYKRETQLKDKAARDPLTGLYNHGTLQDLLQKEYARRKRSGKPLCFLMADIDHFKDINDNYGHSVGDQVLREVSRILETCVREGDVVARYGGEEFAILLDSDKPEVSLALAERIRSRIESHPFIVDGKRVPITVSVGWSCVAPSKVSCCTDIVKQADGFLYRAKEGGRNRVFGEANVS